MFIGIKLGIEVIFQWTVATNAVTLASVYHHRVVFNIFSSPMFKKIVKASIENTFCYKFYGLISMLI